MKITTDNLIHEMARASYNNNVSRRWEHERETKKKIFLKDMQAAIHRLNELGFAIVPIEVTDEMLSKGCSAALYFMGEDGFSGAKAADVRRESACKSIYAAMINEGEVKL
jgi:hypothetical protein